MILLIILSSSVMAVTTFITPHIDYFPQFIPVILRVYGRSLNSINYTITGGGLTSPLMRTAIRPMNDTGHFGVLYYDELQGLFLNGTLQYNVNYTLNYAGATSRQFRVSGNANEEVVERFLNFYRVTERGGSERINDYDLGAGTFQTDAGVSSPTFVNFTE